MKIARCSASAIQSYRHCAFKYFLNYALDLESPSGKAALQGKIVHQVLEWMSKLKKRGKVNVDVEWLLEYAWDMHTSLSPHIEIRRTTSRGEAADFKKCRLCVETILADKHYNPYEMNNIVDIEAWFKLELPGPEWITKDDDGNDQPFAVRGYIDLARELDKDTIEIIDWKTGKRVDFYTRKPIDAYELLRAVQPRLYHLASSVLYSKYKNIIITFYYIEDGGPLTISLGIDDIPMTLASLWKFFDTVKKDTLLVRNRSWQCKMCAYERSKICQRIWSDLHTMGSEYAENRYKGLNFEQQKAITQPQQEPQK